MNFIDTSARSAEEIREAILRRFEAWLDDALAEEEPPSGLPAELLAAIRSGEPLPPIQGHADLHALWSAVTTLTQEVKLQSRTFKQVNDTLSQLPEAVAVRLRQDSASECMQLIEEEGGEEGEPEPVSPAENKRGPEKQHIDLLLELRDRLERGLNSVEEANAAFAASASSSWWARWFPSDHEHHRQAEQVLAALKKGYTLTLDRLDESLRDCHVNPIVCQGRQFDAGCMTAVDVEETDAVPEGTVVGVYRAGYEWEGQLYRSAQVTVARGKLSGTGG